MTGAEKSTTGQINFDSAGVGVVANDQWTDADTLAGIGASAKRVLLLLLFPVRGVKARVSCSRRRKILLTQCRWSS